MFILTRQEKQALIFLLATVLIGCGISFTAKKIQRVGKTLSLDKNTLKIDLNKATIQDLQFRRILTKRIAAAVFEYRKAYGPFKDIDELKNVRGIKDARLERLKEIFYVE